MLVAGVLGALLSLVALRQADERVEVAVAAHDLTAGSVVRARDLSYTRVAASEQVLDGLVAAEDARRIGRLVAGRRVPTGAIIRRSDLRSPAAPRRLRAMSIEVPAARAVGAALASGDRVDVIASGSAEVAIVVADVEVLGVERPVAGGFGTGGDQVVITVAVDAHQSQLVAAALAGSEVFVTRATGARPAIGTPPLPLVDTVAP